MMTRNGFLWFLHRLATGIMSIGFYQAFIAAGYFEPSKRVLAHLITSVLAAIGATVIEIYLRNNRNDSLDRN